MRGSQASYPQYENLTRDSYQVVHRFHRPVAERMGVGFSSRKTTREDTAYSLMGLFNINIPMLHGEGERAFIRLREKILKKFNGIAIFFWQKHGHQGIP